MRLRALLVAVAVVGVALAAPATAHAAVTDPPWAGAWPDKAANLGDLKLSGFTSYIETATPFRLIPYRVERGIAQFGDMELKDAQWPLTVRDGWSVTYPGVEASSCVWYLEAQGDVHASNVPAGVATCVGAGLGEEYADVSVSLVGTGTSTVEVGVEGYGSGSDGSEFVFHPPSPPGGGGYYIARNLPVSGCDTESASATLRDTVTTTRYSIQATVKQSYDATSGYYDYSIHQVCYLSSGNIVQYKRTWTLSDVSRVTSLTIGHGGGTMQIVGYNDTYCSQASEAGTVTYTLDGEVRSGVSTDPDAVDAVYSFVLTGAGMDYLAGEVGADAPAFGSDSQLSNDLARWAGGNFDFAESLLDGLNATVAPFEALIWPVTILHDLDTEWAVGD